MSVTHSPTSVIAKLRGRPVSHPVLIKEAELRATSLQLRTATSITAFAGSMWFVYIHVALFAFWMLFIEKSPWPTLTLVVSLEAIFLSTFVMIGQNQQGDFQQRKAEHDFNSSEKQLQVNTQETVATKELVLAIYGLVGAVHSHLGCDSSPEVTKALARAKAVIDGQPNAAA